ncbi:hypothetical protein CEXT_711271 [Caerostris extrusa]|uniref:Uncharacterized protein n=1 Tax=Caerostris extrusa TaxID=172846 RepID=A0AAV4PVN6_CAEEX|nr:hypothetical protein CEXT_711271 [Caerostris extrusa]
MFELRMSFFQFHCADNNLKRQTLLQNPSAIASNDGLAAKRKTMRKRRGEKNNNRKQHRLRHEKTISSPKVDESSEQRRTE